jgi:hypothetical protein
LGPGTQAETGGSVSRHHVLFPAGGYDHADSQFRAARADRCAGGGRGFASQSPVRRSTPEPDPAGAGAGGSPHDQPELHITVDRTKAQQAGFNQFDIAGGMLVSLSGSFQTTPTFYLNPKNGVTYNVVTQTPQSRRPRSTASIPSRTCKTSRSPHPVAHTRKSSAM